MRIIPSFKKKHEERAGARRRYDRSRGYKQAQAQAKKQAQERRHVQAAAVERVDESVGYVPSKVLMSPFLALSTGSSLIQQHMILIWEIRVSAEAREAERNGEGFPPFFILSQNLMLIYC
jgi:hypothetical protein